MSFTTLDVLYIVLSFCILWFTAAVFWFFWQLAHILKNVNDVIEDARSKMQKMEQVLHGIRDKLDRATSLVGLGANTAAKAVEYAIERKKKIMEQMREDWEEEDEEEMPVPKKAPAKKRAKK